MELLGAFGAFVVAASFVVGAGIVLTKASDVIADKTGWGRLLVGTIFLAFATSLPELMVDLNAVRMGHINLAAGDLMGSSLMNLLILAVVDLFRRNDNPLFSRAAGMHALSATASIVLTGLVALLILLGPQTKSQFLGAGYGSWIILLAYLLCVRMSFLDQAVHQQEIQDLEQQAEWKLSLPQAGVIYVLSAGVILAAAPFLASSAERIATLTGLGQTFIGTTLLALSTSLPEVVVTISAVRMNAIDLAIGNVFGSNAFNMILFVPLDFVHDGPLFASIAATNAVTALAVIVVTGVAVMGQLYRIDNRNPVLEPGAILMLVLILAALTMVYSGVGAVAAPDSPVRIDVSLQLTN